MSEQMDRFYDGAMALARTCSRHPDPQVRQVAQHIMRASGDGSLRPRVADPRMPRTTIPGNLPFGAIQAGMVHPPMQGMFIQPLLPPSRIITVPDIPALAANSDSGAVTLNLSASGGCDDGILIGVKGSVRDDTPGANASGDYEYATLAVQMTFNAQENIVTDGESAAFVPYADLFAPGDRSYFPIMRRVTSEDRMVFRFRNLQPAATGRTLQGSLSFALLQLPYPGQG